jgi:hypothetical protein
MRVIAWPIPSNPPVRFLHTEKVNHCMDCNREICTVVAEVYCLGFLPVSAVARAGECPDMTYILLYF